MLASLPCSTDEPDAIAQNFLKIKMGLTATCELTATQCL